MVDKNLWSRMNYSWLKSGDLQSLIGFFFAKSIRAASLWQLFVLGLVFSFFLQPAVAAAHSLFIQSGRYQVTKGQQVPLFFCFGHHVPVADAVRREKLAFVRVIDPAGKVNEIALRDEKSLHSYVVHYKESGTYTLVAETVPGYYTIYIDSKGREHHSLKPLYALGDKATKIVTSLRSSQWTKSYVACDRPSVPFSGEVGLPLELIPQQNIFSLQEGDSVVFMVKNEGEPYQGQGFWDATYMGFSTESEDMYFPRTAVSGGQFSLPIEHPGRWFVRFFTKTKAPENKHEAYLEEKRTTTLVFEVRNSRRRPRRSGQ